jgi:hypothetical protein
LQPLAQLVMTGTQAGVSSHIDDVVTPSEQDAGSPHAVPGGLAPPATQTGAPVSQEIVPCRQGFVGGVQAAPAVQDTQLPALHTRFVPQLFPSGASCPVSVQATIPLVQLVIPTWHGLLGVQGFPAVHDPHVPLWHT